MAKLRLEKSILLISLIIIFGSCGYQFIKEDGKKVFIHTVSNSTLQPKIDLYLADELKKTLIEYPEFSLVNNEGAADYVLCVDIKRWERMPLFFSKAGEDEITIAKFKVETELSVSCDGKQLLHDIISDTFSVSLVSGYKEEEILQRISQKLSGRIYFYLLEKNEKKRL